jgi:hypothetical protein
MTADEEESEWRVQMLLRQQIQRGKMVQKKYLEDRRVELEALQKEMEEKMRLEERERFKAEVQAQAQAEGGIKKGADKKGAGKRENSRKPKRGAAADESGEDTQI